MFTLKLTINLRLFRRLITQLKLWVKNPKFKAITVALIKLAITITVMLLIASVISNIHNSI